MKVHLLPLIPGLGLSLVLAADPLIIVDPDGFDAAESTKMDERFSTAAMCCFNFCIHVSLANAYSGSSRSCNLAASSASLSTAGSDSGFDAVFFESCTVSSVLSADFCGSSPSSPVHGEQGPPASAKGAESCSPASWKNKFSSLIVTNTAKNTTIHYR